jgi:hypothetical protein
VDAEGRGKAGLCEPGQLAKCDEGFRRHEMTRKEVAALRRMLNWEPCGCEGRDFCEVGRRLRDGLVAQYMKERMA